MLIDRRAFLSATAAGVSAVSAGGALAAQVEETLFSFCVVADPHCSEEPKAGIERYGNGVEKLLACVRAMEALEGPDRPAFMLIAGDLHVDALAGCLDRVTIPIRPIAGNHEATREGRDKLAGLFPDCFRLGEAQSDYYSFVHKGVRFVGVCDAGSGGDHVGHFTSELIRPLGQCAWLEEQLATPERKVLFGHIPPHPEAAEDGMRMSRTASLWFNALVEERGPEVMFWGHLHQATATYDVGATRCVILRSCCWNGDRSCLGFAHVRVTTTGMVLREIETGAYAEG